MFVMAKAPCIVFLSIKIYKFCLSLFPYILFRTDLIMFINSVFVQSLYAQDYGREINKKEELNSLLVHFKNKWEISLSYGQWFFNNKAKSTEEELFFLPENMGIWQFSAGWHFAEKWFTGITIGI